MSIDWFRRMVRFDVHQSSPPGLWRGRVASARFRHERRQSYSSWMMVLQFWSKQWHCFIHWNELSGKYIYENRLSSISDAWKTVFILQLMLICQFIPTKFCWFSTNWNGLRDCVEWDGEREEKWKMVGRIIPFVQNKMISGIARQCLRNEKMVVPFPLSKAIMYPEM